MPDRKMKSVSRGSISDEFEVACECPVPATPLGGARVKVYYAGACYTDRQVAKSGQKHLKSPGIRDTSLFPGYEVSGVVDDICHTVEKCDLHTGDKVIVYPDDKEEDSIQQGNYAEFITVKNIKNLIRIPEFLQLEVAALLPCGALKAYAAVMRAKLFVQLKMEQGLSINLLIVGAGGLGLWTMKLAKHFIGGDCTKVHTTVADTCVHKLELAKQSGCYDVIHWCDSVYEEQIVERTKNVCNGGVDVVIDFVSSPRTIERSLKVLREDGVLLVGGNSCYQISFCLKSLAENNQSILGTRKGSREQLQKLVDTLAAGLVTPPVYSVYPVDEANRVFNMLNECQIKGRAVLQICPEEKEDDDSSVFEPENVKI